MADKTRGVALITGASSGIGETFAEELAARGYDLILVARRQDKLERICEQLREKYSVKCQILSADLARDEDIEKVASRIKETENLTMLINNAGFGAIGDFGEVDFGRQLDMISVHVLAAVKLCRAALPNMIAEKRGDIINVSSVAGFMATPGNINYCATKAYLIPFSEGLQEELKDKGIRVQALCPGFTCTEFHEVGDLVGFDRSHVPKGWWMSAEYVVRESLKALEKGRVTCIPHIRYRLIVTIVRNRFLARLLRPLIRRRRR